MVVFSLLLSLLSIPSSFSSHLYSNPDNPFSPQFAILLRSNCCQSQSDALSTYLKDSNIPFNVTSTIVTMCNKMNAPLEPEYSELEKGPIYLMLSEEDKEEPFCIGMRYFTGVGFYALKNDGILKWQGHLQGIQSPRFDAEMGLPIGDWPKDLSKSIAVRILLESAILLYQRRITKKNITAGPMAETKSQMRRIGVKRIRQSFKHGTTEIQIERPDLDATGEVSPDLSPHYLWLFAIIPVFFLLIAAFGYYRYKQKRKQLLARKTYIKVVYKGDTAAGKVQWHESSQSASEEDKSTSVSSKSSIKSPLNGSKEKKEPMSVRKYMHNYFERNKSSG